AITNLLLPYINPDSIAARQSKRRIEHWCPRALGLDREPITLRKLDHFAKSCRLALAVERNLAQHAVPIVDHNFREWRERGYASLKNYLPTARRKMHRAARQFSVHTKINQWPGGEKRVTLAHTIDPTRNPEWPVQMNIGPHASDRAKAMQVIDGILA